MSTARVDKRYRITIRKQIRAKVNVKAGDTVKITLLDDLSFKVEVLDFTSQKVEDDPAWKAFHPPAKAKRYIPPEKLEEIMEETEWPT
jgi:AbrB family looped-hinge helix DNA binding protein